MVLIYNSFRYNLDFEHGYVEYFALYLPILPYKSSVGCGNVSTANCSFASFSDIATSGVGKMAQKESSISVETSFHKPANPNQLIFP